MGLGDLFKANENKSLRERINELEAMLTPEMKDLLTVRSHLSEANTALSARKAEIMGAEADLLRIKSEISAARKNLIETNDTVLLQEFGLYQPKYDFETSEMYKSRLDDIRRCQKDMIKANKAATGNMNWTVNNSTSKGHKMVSDMQKLLLRAFNSECDEVIGKVKFNNIDTAVKRITASKDAISKLGAMMGVEITRQYYDSKIDELHLAYEYQVKKQEEKEEQKRIREEMREQAKLQKEIEMARREIEKEQKHYQNALAKITAQIESASETELDLLNKKKEEIEIQLSELDKAIKDVDYREANQKAGYVYVISNIGAFGEGVYKIGMTRRLDPMDRIDELGDASVPFNFDVHAMIFTEDAPGLEAALHRAFDSRKLNMVNTRREFFRVSLDEIKQVVKENFDKTVEFIDVPDAEQYRQSLILQGKSA